MKQYTLDTNIFRHQTNESDSRQLRSGAQATWDKMIKEVDIGEAVLLVPKEVAFELDLQSFTLKKKQNEAIANLIELCKEVEPEVYTFEIEKSLRRLTAYVKSKHGSILGHRIERLEASDARILYTAYDENSILVTANVKDFMLYPLLFPEGEERIYCMKNNQYIKVPTENYKAIQKDPEFIALRQTFYDAEIRAEGEEST
ncbi:PIN domain-containing protein [Metabacillus indicus]|uniref:DUF4411 family protein n=1 Tax=Metabacillus indicus TaxID=246786 RepID=UPI00068BDDAB|nr:DUF4411 family protein [Metabacillus indicus]